MKKLITIILVVSIISGSTSFTNAATTTQYEDQAQKLSLIDVFKGTDQGFELERQPTRLEGLIMLLRLLGKEDDALAAPKKDSYFSDVPDWGVVYTNYAFENELTKGIGDNKFGSTQAIVSKSYHTFLLRALGYNDSAGDFSWSMANNFILEKGIVSKEYYEDISSNTFLRDHVAKSSFDTLFFTVKASNNRLVDLLIESGDIDEAIVDANFIVTSEVTDKLIEDDESNVSTEQTIHEKMLGLKVQYPEGMPWTNDDFYSWEGGIFNGGSGCAGFAFLLSDAGFASLKAREHTDFSNLRVGDIVRINNDTHSVIILSVDNTQISVAEGNYNSSIHWGRTFSLEEIKRVGNYILTRYPE